MSAAQKVIDLEQKRDALQKRHDPDEVLRERIVDLKKKRKRAKTEAEQKALDAEIAALDAQRGRSPAHTAVMLELVDARASALQELLDAFVASLADKTDEELEVMHLEATAKRAALKPMVAALSRLRSSRAKVAANKVLLKDLTAEEILASLTPAQRTGLTSK